METAEGEPVKQNDAEEETKTSPDEVKAGTADVVNAGQLQQNFVPVKTRSRGSVREAWEYRDGETMVERSERKSRGIEKATATKLGKAQEKGIMDSRTVADMVLKPGDNPFSVESMGASIILQFRRKSIAIVIVQSILVNAIAVIIDRFVPLPDASWQVYIAFWLVPLALLGVLTLVRYKSPWNWIVLVAFSVTISITFGALRVPMQVYAQVYVGPDTKLWSPQCYGMAGHTIALMLLSAITCIQHPRGRVIKMLPSALVVAVITDVAGVVAYVTYWNYIGPPLFAGIAIAMNTLSLLWIGHQMDKLCSRLQVDEYFQPVVLLWCEVFLALLMTVVVLLTLAAALASGEGGCEGCGDCCECSGFYYCDCYIDYGSPTEQKQQEREQGETAAEPATAPTPQEMPGAVP
eukprot:TRINITY_DN39036_c0_g1_i1.p1 TRINITY_DN39036_c0_g1~~TRINITY_DN39036_c0_g1_i1.p1  ORF type:complete len:407 (-),score=76.64 TRINITY_DN39036_c0_g1_i1:54-1274(-)